MRLLSTEVFVKGREGRPVFPGFVGYVSSDRPVLMHRYGWVDASDTYDDFADSFSEDNGLTWSEPETRLRSHQVPGGRVRYAENACFFDDRTGRLITLCSRALYPEAHLDVDARFEVVYDVLDPATGEWRGEEVVPHDLPGGLGISFCFPIRGRSGRLLVPAYTTLRDAEGHARHYPGCWAPLETALTLLGHLRADGSVAWEVGRPVAVDPEQSSRGFSENTIAVLNDGRLVAILRGDNSMFPERPGTKWHCFSEDEGRTWSDPKPLPCTEGEPIESGSNGSALFRCARSGQLLWIGNLALEGERAKANWPRSPLAIAEMQEEPFGLKRDTICLIDRRQPDEPPLTQMSNFRYHQDRETGDVVVFLSRFGERDPDNFRLADYYRYRVALR